MGDQKNPTLDGLRAVAVLFVLLGHFPMVGTSVLSDVLWKAPKFLNLPYIGVDLFFCLSGYLIAKVLMPTEEVYGGRLKAFYFKRFARIFPAYFLVAITSFIFLDQRYFLEIILFVSNFTFAHDPVTHPLRHTWSLAVELQYYLCFPLLLFLAGDRSTFRRLLLILAVVIVASTFVIAVSFPEKLKYIDKYPNFRFLTLMAGAYLYMIEDKVVSFARDHVRIVVYMLVLSIALGSCARFLPFESAYFTLRYLCSFITTLCLFVLAMYVIGAEGTFGKILRSKRATQLAEISYGVYLFHQPILYAFGVSHLQAHDPVTFIRAFLMLFIIFGVSSLSFYFYERPLLRKVKRSVE